MRFSLAALSTVLLMSAVYASPAPGGGGDDNKGHDDHNGHDDHDDQLDFDDKYINIEKLEYVTNKYYCIEENHTIDLKLLTKGGDGCAQSALLELGLLNIL